MFWIPKKNEAKKHSDLIVLSSSWKKKNFFDIFKINPFVLTSFIIAVLVCWLLMIEITKNKVIIDSRNEKLSLNYSQLIEIKNTLWFLNWLKTQTFDWKKIIKILNYLEDLSLYSYKLEFNPTKQYYFVSLKSINQEKLDEIMTKWLKSWTMNYFKTNQTLKIIEEWKISISIIFN